MVMQDLLPQDIALPRDHPKLSNDEVSGRPSIYSLGFEISVSMY